MLVFVLNAHSYDVVTTVEIQYNGLEGTGQFWLLNPNVVKSNFFFFIKKIYMLNELQWLGKKNHRVIDIASDRPAFIYSWSIIAYKIV